MNKIIIVTLGIGLLMSIIFNFHQKKIIGYYKRIERTSDISINLLTETW